jgi:homoserine kinase type II
MMKNDRSQPGTSVEESAEAAAAPQQGARVPAATGRLAEGAAKPIAAQHLGPKVDDTIRRERFDAAELAIVLSHYDIGVIERIKEYPRGSRRAPKVRIETSQGEFLLKRRAPGRENPYKVAFAHRLQLQLAEHGFPVPRLLGTRGDNNSIVQYQGAVYEMFEYVRGDFFNSSNRESQYAGFTLARLHRMLGGHEIIYDPPEGSYHAAPGLHAHVAAIPRAVSTVDVNADETELLRISSFLHRAYDEAAAAIEALGYSQWRKVVVHGDWHPGNLLFRDHRVVAVIDFDSARLEPRIADIANGALQFSMLIGEADSPSSWPDGLATERLRAFVRGYDQGAETKLAEAELIALPLLIIEALIAESVVPIATTGSFARLPGAPFLAMIERKVRWLQPRARKLSQFVGESRP